MQQHPAPLFLLLSEIQLLAAYSCSFCRVPLGSLIECFLAPAAGNLSQQHLHAEHAIIGVDAALVVAVPLQQQQQLI
jgi:hypothetical protein